MFIADGSNQVETMVFTRVTPEDSAASEQISDPAEEGKGDAPCGNDLSNVTRHLQ